MGHSDVTFDTVLEHAPIPVACLDHHLNYIRVNKAYASICQKSPGFFPGRNHFELVPDSEIKRIFTMVAAAGKPCFIQSKPLENFGHPENSTTCWDWSLVPVINTQGETEQIIISLYDVTVREGSEHLIRKSEKNYRNLVEHAPVGAYRTTLGGTYVYVNNEYVRILGYDSIHDILTKSLRTSNPFNVVYATFEALRSLRTQEDVAQLRRKGESNGELGRP